MYKFKATPICVNKIKKCKRMGYGCEEVMDKNTSVDIFGIGYTNKFFLKIFNNNRFAESIQDILMKEMYDGSITYKGKSLKIIGQSDMNYTFVDIEDISKNEVFDINISALNIDSSVKKYLK